jgi:hypothetical protein
MDSATASDPDGTIANVAFYADGVNIGNGAPIGGNQYSFTWSGITFATYAITAVATDNDGKTTSVAGPNVSVTTPVLFVTGSTTLNASDTAVKSRLEALGHTVVVKDGASAVTADATGKALVVISSTVTPTSVGTKFRTVTVPVITWESGSSNNINTNGSVGNGYEINIPADRTVRTLKLYVGVWFTQGKLQATLSDGSAPDFIDTSLNKNNDRASGLYTITYKAASAGQTLKVRFTILTQYFSPNGNVAWEAATLQ